MKTLKVLLAVVAVLALIEISGVAQTYQITRFAIAGGGGTSSGGVYSLSGTIGQHDAGILQGGNYSLSGGFWGAAIALQTPGAPLLTITGSSTGITISWPSPSTGFLLQESPSLLPAKWTQSTQTVSDNGTVRSVTVAPPTGLKFYRLAN
jgi:hypothetical protein